jgi:hypothetical protein
LTSTEQEINLQTSINTSSLVIVSEEIMLRTTFISLYLTGMTAWAAALVPESRDTRLLRKNSETTLLDGKLFCGCGANVDPEHVIAAKTMLKEQFGAEGRAMEYPAYFEFAGPNKDVVAFVCHYNNLVYGTWAAKIEENLSAISEQCGLGVPGIVAGQPGSWAQGYMKYEPGLDFCGVAAKMARGTC